MSKVSKKKQTKSNKNNDRSKRLVEIGTKFHLANQVQPAEDCYRKAIEANPMNFRALYLQGILCSQAGSNDKAIEFLKLAIKVNPNYSMAYNDIGVVYQSMGNVKEAMINYGKALELNKDFHEAKNNLGVAYQSKGEPEKAREYFRQALEINKYYFDAANNYIFALDLSENETVDSLIQVRKEWAKVHETPFLSKQKPHTNELTTNRKIRVGYLSGDFRFHSASFCFGTMLTNYDREKFEVYAYANLQVKPDQRTEVFKKNVTVWRDIFNVDDDIVANMIRQDKIDILVDLSTFSSGSRLLVFARKPAPLQCTGWGYATSSGMSSMDFYLADDVIVPEEEKHKYVEKVLDLPCVINYFCPEVTTEVKELPALKTGVITFGSFNRVAKISDKAFETWAACINAVPGSRMLFKINEADPNATKDRIVETMKGYGVDPKRLWFAGKTSLNQHLEAFNDIDIHLDSFVHSGGLTSADALLCGVPVVTYKFPSVVGRLTSSFLERLDMKDWIAESPEDYVRIVKEKCADLNALAELRKGLRERFMKSPMGDQIGYCRGVEKLYLKMWEDYVQSKQT